MIHFRILDVSHEALDVLATFSSTLHSCGHVRDFDRDLTISDTTLVGVQENLQL